MKKTSVKIRWKQQQGDPSRTPSTSCHRVLTEARADKNSQGQNRQRLKLNSSLIPNNKQVQVPWKQMTTFKTQSRGFLMKFIEGIILYSSVRGTDQQKAQKHQTHSSLTQITWGWSNARRTYVVIWWFSNLWRQQRKNVWFHVLFWSYIRVHFKSVPSAAAAQSQSCCEDDTVPFSSSSLRSSLSAAVHSL